MTKEEAIEAMQTGKAVTHRNFPDGEYIYMQKDRIYNEEGESSSPEDFWNSLGTNGYDTDWSIQNISI